jgi:hypothetical protein
LLKELSKEEIIKWNKKYDEAYEKYERELENSVGKNLKLNRELSKNDLIKIVEWKFGGMKGRKKIFLNLIKPLDGSDVQKISKDAFCSADEWTKIEKLRKIKGVKNALTSVILTFLDPENYGVFDIHAFDELYGTNPKTRPKDMFTDSKYLHEFLSDLRQIAKKNGFGVRYVEKAYFKKNYDENQ